MAYDAYDERPVPRPDYEQQQVVGSSLSRQHTSGWVSGFVVFAAAMMMMIGFFQGIQGLAAILNDSFYVVTPDYSFEIDVTTWGWIHLIGGIVIGLSGIFLLTGNIVARIVGIVVALLSAINNFLYVPYYPFWSILIIAVNIVVIWALTKDSLEEG